MNINLQDARILLQQLNTYFANLREPQCGPDEVHVAESERVEDGRLAQYVSSEHVHEVVDEQPAIAIGVHKFPYPTPIQQHARAVWRNRHFAKYIESIRITNGCVYSALVTKWFKKHWFGDKQFGEQRLEEAGFTRAELSQLTTHHIVPAELGGHDSVYNYHLMLAGPNAHFGSLFTKESIAWVGVEHAHVAKSFAKFAKRHCGDAVDDRRFDPFALACPRQPVEKRRVVVHDKCQSPLHSRRMGVVLEVRAAASPLAARVEEIDDADEAEADAPPAPPLAARVEEIDDADEAEADAPPAPTLDESITQYLDQQIRRSHINCPKCEVAITSQEARESFTDQGGKGRKRNVNEIEACPLFEHGVSKTKLAELLDTSGPWASLGPQAKRKKVDEYMLERYGVTPLGKPNGSKPHTVPLYSYADGVHTPVDNDGNSCNGGVRSKHTDFYQGFVCALP